MKRFASSLALLLLTAAAVDAQVRDCGQPDAPYPYAGQSCSIAGQEVCTVSGNTLICDLSQFDDEGCTQRVGGTGWVVTGYGPQQNAINAWGSIFGDDAASFCCVISADRNRQVRRATLRGTCGDDTMLAFSFNAGNTRYNLDSIDLVSLDATLQGGAGSDLLEGSMAMNSKLYREALDGGPDADRINGLDGNDILIGGFGVDRLEGGPGDDLLCESSGRAVEGAAACDGGQSLVGGEGDDILYMSRVRPCLNALPAEMDGGGGKDRCGDPVWEDVADDSLFFSSCRSNLDARPAACPSNR